MARRGDGSLTLAPSVAARREEREAWLAARREGVARGLAGAAGAAGRLGFLDREEVVRLSSDETGLGVPIQRLLLRVLARMGAGEFVAKEVVARETVRRTVFALEPTARQRSLPAGAVEDLRTYREERRRFLGAQGSGGAYSGRGLYSEPGSEVHEAERMLLIVRSEADSVRVTLLLFDSAGAQTARGEATFPDAPAPVAAPVRLPFAFVPSKGEERVWSLVSASGRPREIAAGEMARVVAGEPLSLLPSDAILDAAHRAGRSVIVAAGDGLLDREWAEKGDLGEWLGERGRVALDGERWLTVRADAPYLTRATFFPRARLLAAVRAFGGMQDETIESLAAAYRLRPDWPWDLPTDALMDRVAGWGTDQNERALLAALTPAEWRAAQTQDVPLSALSPKAREAARTLLFSFRLPAGKGDSEWFAEPTNLTANLRPALRVRREVTEGVGVRTSTGEPSFFSFGDYRRLLADPGYTMQGDEGPKGFDVDLSRVRFVGIVWWSVAVLTGEGRERSFGRPGGTVALDPGTYTLATIPARFRRLIEATRSPGDGGRADTLSR